MDIITAIVLGIVQGLTEFLPVSSSGHLVLLQKIFGVDAPGLFFDTMLHIGTLTAVFVVLWKDIWEILKKIIQPLTGFLIIATIPAVIFALAFKDIIESAFESGQFLGVCFLITSALLVTAEQLANRAEVKRSGENMNWVDAVIIGVFQAVAIVPGISRSGATISGALSRKLDRDFAARFSFLLSIPAILGALVLQIKDLVKGEGAAGAPAGEVIGVLPIAIGTVTAAIVGFFAVKFMLKLIKEKKLYGFAIYTAALGIFVLIDQFVTRIVF
ncbi:undecaprenyl-diphosphate phosphatase [Treponema sp. R6D11]